MSLDWKSYEAVTKHIYETLGKQSGVSIECFGNSCKVTGKSGVEHQVDVLTKHSDGIHIYRTAIECKYWSSKINKDIVMKVTEIIEDAKINKGVIVSKEGFTPDGIKFAQHKNIGLVELREMRDEDWEGRDKNPDLNGKVVSKRPQILDFIIDFEGEEKKVGELVKTSEIEFHLPNNKVKPLSFFIQDFNKRLSKLPVGEKLAAYYELKGSTLTNKEKNTSLKVNGLELRGELIEVEQELTFYAVDRIWLIMKSLFEDRTFTISRGGKVQEEK